MSIAIAANRKSKERISCANCGQEENDEAKLKACVVCMLVKYCNKECQIAHRPLHKKSVRYVLLSCIKRLCLDSLKEEKTALSVFLCCLKVKME